MRIGSQLYDEIVAHALRDAPDECCGIVSSRDGDAVAVFPMENTAHTWMRYEMDNMELYRVLTGIEEAGLEVGIIYHSHTRTDPYPSQTDINLAFYPDSLYVIVGTASEEPVVRAFTIRDGRVTEVHLEVV
ncbi:MAG TPA: M67 family metallopeptidase [Solirubrobacteraceae bacterium]|nr:M67 family metallopeptidase [Solirubrobacteraceae bacterium]